MARHGLRCASPEPRCGSSLALPFDGSAWAPLRFARASLRLVAGASLAALTLGRVLFIGNEAGNPLSSSEFVASLAEWRVTGGAPDG
jgi:hypothetical protein